MQATNNFENKKAIHVVALALQRKSDLKYLVARRGPGQSGAGEWEFPGGKVESGETQIEALAREIKEELGFELAVDQLVPVADHEHIYPEKTVHLYLWKQQIMQVPVIELTEHDQLRWLSIEELQDFDLSAGDLKFIPFLSFTDNGPGY